MSKNRFEMADLEKSKLDLVPGTIHLIDVEGDLNIQKDEGSEHDIILQPQPSSNVNDPLRWSKRKKNVQFGLLWMWAFLLAVTVNWNGPVWTIWTEVFDCSYDQLNISAAICFIFLGVGCVLLQPTALKFGRRFVYLLCTFFVIIANLIGALAQSVQYLYAVNFLSGMCAAPVDSLVEISTTDVFFQHERAEYLSWMIFALYAGSDLGPVAAGYIVETMDWRWCLWFQVIIFGALLAILLFTMEDTTFDREQDKTEEDILVQIKSRESALQSVVSQNSNDREAAKESPLISTCNVELDKMSIDGSIPKRTYWQRMRLMEFEYSDKRSWLTIFYRPFLMVRFPAFIWAGIVYGSQMMWLSLLATTQSEIYALEPYNFSESQVGLTNLGAFVGSIFGMFYGGKFVDYLSIKFARRNGGILEPEYRLYAMAIPTILNAGGLLAYGLSSHYSAHWAISVVIGQGLLGFAMSSTGGICLTYAVDCYPNLASDGLVLILFLRNCIGCGFTFAIQPWLDRDGLSLTTWLMFMLSLVINGSYLIMVFWGKSFRRWTANAYFKYSDPNYGEIFKKKGQPQKKGCMKGLE